MPNQVKNSDVLLISEKKPWNKRKTLELEMLNISIYVWLRSRIEEITVLKQTKCQYNFTDAS